MEIRRNHSVIVTSGETTSIWLVTAPHSIGIFLRKLKVIQKSSIGIDSVLTPLVFCPSIATLMTTVDYVCGVAKPEHKLIIKIVLSWNIPARGKIMHARFWCLRGHVKP